MLMLMSVSKVIAPVLFDTIVFDYTISSDSSQLCQVFPHNDDRTSGNQQVSNISTVINTRRNIFRHRRNRQAWSYKEQLHQQENVRHSGICYGGGRKYILTLLSSHNIRPPTGVRDDENRDTKIYTTRSGHCETNRTYSSNS